MPARSSARRRSPQAFASTVPVSEQFFADRSMVSFRIKGDADARARWISGEIAAMRVPDLPALAEEPLPVVTLRVAALRWRESRIDVAPATRETLRKRASPTPSRRSGIATP